MGISLFAFIAFAVCGLVLLPLAFWVGTRVHNRATHALAFGIFPALLLAAAFLWLTGAPPLPIALAVVLGFGAFMALVGWLSFNPRPTAL